jgi:hypothetical protein
MMDKRGQGGLSMNTIVVAIIAIIVLLLIVTFFTGGLGTIGQRITEVFKTGTAGYDANLAVKNCQDYCAAAQKLPTDALKKNSPYCSIDFNVEGYDDKQSCEQLGVGCPKIDNLAGCD